MFGTLESIGVTCGGPAIGWLTHLYLIDCKDVAFDVYPDTLLSAENALWLAVDRKKVVTEIKLRAKTATFSESLQQSQNGESYSSQITVPLPTHAKNIIAWVHRNARKRFVAIFRDTDGNCYLAGTKNNGMQLGWTRSIQNTLAQQMQLTSQHWHGVLWISTVDPEKLFPFKEFDYSFDLSFS
ncbi:hypothetical protein [Dyadobacter diqingensis]|uniref:hypothetical protein n=1 Tax=Dyadobacter diqingensis TaxID=2938121 RepID=UPI0020C24F56|nr:hypothetical protein [Dyadobacter diqingensis]